MLRAVVGVSMVLSVGLQAAPAAPSIYEVTTLAGIPGLAGFHDDYVHAATLNRPTWLDVVTDEEANLGNGNGKPGDIYFVDRANEALRRISGGKVSTVPVSSTINGQGPLDYGGPLGGGVLIEPAGSGCGSDIYDRGIWIAASGSQFVPLISFSGRLASRDGAPIVGSGSPGAIDGHVFSAAFHTPTGLARSHPYFSGDLTTQRALYIADTGNHTIRRVRFILSFEACPEPWTVETLAGGAGMAGSTDAQGTAARFNQPRGLATAADGSLYVADSGNHTIRRIDANGSVTTVAGVSGVPGNDDGPALAAHLNTPSGIDFNNAGDLFITDTGNHTVRVLTKDGMLITIAGFPDVAGFADGIGSGARFSGPVGIRALADGTILVADTSNDVIRRLAPVIITKHRPVSH